MTAGLHGPNPDRRGPKPPAWACEPLIALLDGPMAGQWYTATDWSQRLAAARGMAARGQRAAAALTYSATGLQVPHPHVAEATAAGWATNPTDTANDFTGDQDGDHQNVDEDGVHELDGVDEGWVW